MKYSKHKIIALIIIAGFLLLMASIAMASAGPGDGNLLKRSAEETCHACHKTYKNAPSDPDAIKSHSSTDTGKWPTGWGIAGGKYGEIVCTTCHTSHDTKNIYLIREQITAPNAPTDQFPGSNVDFRYFSGSAGGDTGYYSFGDDTACYEASYTDQNTCETNGGTWNSIINRCNYPSLMDSTSCTGAGHEWSPRTTSTRICEVCHSKNRYHNYDSTLNVANGGDFTHNNAGDCTACHPHSSGFTPAGGACDSCHGNPPTQNTLGGPDGLAKYSDNSGTGSNNAGKHQYHATSSGLSLSCETCHTNYVMPENSLKRIQIGFNIFGTGGGSYDGQTGVNYEGKNGTTVSNSGTRQCSNIYCHSSVQGNGGSGTPTYATPQWLDTATAVCGTCHKADGVQGNATIMDSGSHTKHVSTPYSVACSVCHNGAGSGSALHVNNNIEVSLGGLGSGGSYSQASNPPGNGYGTCSTVYCHGTTTPTWGGASLGCDGCHYGNSTLAGKHSVHYASATVATSSSFTPSNSSTTSTYIYTCGVCHNATNHVGGPVSANQAAQISFDSTVAGGGTYTAGSLVGADRGFNWTGGTCSSTYCHSNGAGGAPNNTTFNWNSAAGTLTCAGCHNYTKASGTPMASGSHTAHINNADAALGTWNCYQCHNATTTNDTTISDKTKHVNKTKDVAFTTLNPSGSYASPNCSNLYCHSTGNLSAPTANLPAAYGGSHYTTMAWNGSAIGCNGCHGKTVSAGAPDYTNQGAGQPGANSHMKHTSSGTDVTSCDTCHTNTTNTGTSIKAGSALHINNTRDVTFNATKAGASATYTSGTKTCSNIACHGNAQWGGTLGCVNCHNATVSSPIAQGLGGPSTRRNVVAEFALASSHKRSAGGTVTNNDCGVCHMEGNAADGTTTANHRDGYIDLRDPDTGALIKQAQWSGTGAGSLSATTTDARFLQFSRNLSADLQTDTNYLNLAGIELNHCLKCHDSTGAGSTLARVPGGSATNPFGGTGTPIDAASQFATTNRSYHPVLGKQNNSYTQGTRMLVPWNITKTNGNSTSWGLLMTCWDCHAPNNASGTLTSTVTAHGSAKTVPGTVYVELRGSVWMTGAVGNTNNTTLCIKCHAGYDTSTSSNHSTGSAITSNTNGGMSLYLRYACYYCHSSGPTIPTTRADAAADVHGSSTRRGGTAFAQTQYGYGFIRSEGFYANGYSQQPLRVGATTYTARCTGFNGTNGSTNCARGSMGNYTPGGVY